MRAMVLGLVRWLQPVHGYDVLREATRWGGREWARLAPGSVYHALRTLTQEGALEVVRTERRGSRPPRTTYRLTDRGHRELATALEELWREADQQPDTLTVGLALLPLLSRSHAVRLLRDRAEALAERATADVPAPLPVHLTWLFEFDAERAATEAAWCRRLAEMVEAGVGDHAGD
jgi:DNA-binding PadR family transcriptional regulator